MVLWERLDRLVGDSDRDDSNIQNHWLKLTESLEQHLALVFHRFLEAPRKAGRLRIVLNDNEINAWNPFSAGHPATAPE